jgi:ABC-type sugar transport system substrate-binding protein
MRSQKNWLAITALFGAVVLALAGCSSTGTASPTSGASSALSAKALSQMKADLNDYSGLVTHLPAVSSVSSTSRLKGGTVWWVPLGPPIDASNGPAIREGLGKLGIIVHTCDGNFVPTTIASCLQQAGNAHPAAVITGYIDYKAIPTAFDTLVSQGVPVLLAGAVNDSGKAQSAKFAFGDTTTIFKTIARLQVESAIVQSNGRAHILWVGSTDSVQLSQIPAYAQSFAKANCPKCTFSQISTNSASLTKLASEVGATLTAQPNTDYVLTQIDTATPSVIQAIQTAGLRSKVEVIGGGGSPETIADLQADRKPLVNVVGHSYAYEGWAFDQAVVKMLSGKVPQNQLPSLFRVFTTTNVKGLSVSSESLGTVDWFAKPSAVESSFLNAWGVK